MSSQLWEVPSSWRWVQVRDIADVVGGGTPPAGDASNFDDNGTPWVTPADLTGYDGTYLKRGRRGLSVKGLAGCGATVMPAGTVLFSSRAPIGYCAIAGNPISTNQGFKSLVLGRGVSSEFVRYYLLSAKEYAESLASGTTFKELSGARMAGMAVPLPSLEEQQRIVSKLDNLFARSCAAREELTRIPRLVEQYKRAVLATAFNREETKKWCQGLLQDRVSEGLIGLIRSKSEQSSSGTPYIRMNHYDLEGRWNQGDLTYVEASATELKRYELLAGDVLFNTRNSTELVGKVAIWPADKTGFVYNNNLLRLRFKSGVLPQFAALYMKSPSFSAYLESVKSATTSVAAIYQRSLYAAPFPIPDLCDQQRIAESVIFELNRIESMTRESARAFTLLDRLDQATLAKAFRGELLRTVGDPPRLEQP